MTPTRDDLANQVKTGSLKRLFVRGREDLAVPWCTIVFKEIKGSTVTPFHGYWVFSLPRAVHSSEVDFVAQSIKNSSHELEFSDSPFRPQ